MAKKKRTEYTQAEFASKIGVHESTVWRWVTYNQKRLKMYDASVVDVGGKKFVRVVSKTGKV